MRQILPLELVGNNKLDFDLYDEQGKLVYENGKLLTPDLLMKFTYMKVFIKQDKLNESDFEFKKLKTPEKLIIKLVIPEKTTQILATNARKLLKKVYNNEKLDINVYQETTDMILQEVSKNLEKIECIAQLRVYDEYTFSHTVNVSAMSSALGMTLGLSENQIKELALGALLHDIGKMRIPIDILNKPKSLDPEEFEIMKSHTLFGYKYITENMEINDSIARVSLDHQEKYAGGGYPNGLQGKEINLYAQVAAIADVYDALISTRIYKKAVDPMDAVEIMIAESKKSFNPYMFDKFLKLANYKMN